MQQQQSTKQYLSLTFKQLSKSLQILLQAQTNIYKAVQYKSIGQKQDHNYHQETL